MAVEATAGPNWAWWTVVSSSAASLKRASPSAARLEKPAKRARLVPYERDEKALVPERCLNMWWLGFCPNHHIFGSLLRARGIFITLVG